METEFTETNCMIAFLDSTVMTNKAAKTADTGQSSPGTLTDRLPPRKVGKESFLTCLYVCLFPRLSVYVCMFAQITLQ